MKITIHQTLLRDWGYETPYTIDDNGKIYNNFVPNNGKLSKAELETLAIAQINEAKARLAAEENSKLDDLKAKKAELLAEIDSLTSQITDIEAK